MTLGRTKRIACAWFSHQNRHPMQSVCTGLHAWSHTHKETDTMIILWALPHKRCPDRLLLCFPLDRLHCCWHMHTHQKMIHAARHWHVQHSIRQFLSTSYLKSCATERKRLWPYWDVSVAFISQQETFKARWANVRGRSERLPAARGRKSGAVSSSRVRVVITAHDKYHYWPICKTRHTKNTLDECSSSKPADVRPLVFFEKYNM